MVIVKQIYMGLVSFYSHLFFLFKRKKRVIYLMSFPDNDKGFIKSLAEEIEVVVFYKQKCAKEANKLKKNGIKVYPMDNPIYLVIYVIPFITLSRIVIIDNYFPVLGGIKKRNQEFIQIWHAIGAIKQFGLEDKQLLLRKESDIRRYQKVYQSIDKYVVASRNMGEVFKKSYNAKEEQILYFGLPRADQLVGTFKKKSQNMQKKQILYAPTYREGQNTLPPLDLAKLEHTLSHDYQLTIKLHPHIQHLAEKEKDTDFIKWHRSTNRLDDLVRQADILMTDYSSVAFDYSLANPLSKVIFFWYDEEEYNHLIGIQPRFLSMDSFVAAQSTEDVVNQVKKNSESILGILNDEWNTYNDGKSAERLIHYILELLGE